jgi:DNA repair exonuclease SbcCD nuclease subunit
MKIVHVADIHLGRRRLDGRLPDKDFADAFGFVASKAIEEKADAFLIAGDLFDRPQVEPPHLRQAQQVLVKLKQAGIPVIAIEGNHDKASILSDAPTWLQYLAEDDLLILLRTPFDSTGPLLTQWENAQNGGSWIDLDGVRFVGTGYYGAATPHKAREIASRLEPERTHVLLLHAGPEYFVREGGGFSPADLEVLRSKICYLALGHIHQPMTHGDWACNPGSPENCDLREAACTEPRGYAIVEIDPAIREKPRSIKVQDNPRRAVYRLSLDCTSFGNKLKKGADALVNEAIDLIKKHKPAPESIVALRLTGKLNLDRIALDQTSACAEIEKASKVRAVSIDTTGLNIESGPVEGDIVLPGEEELSREELEKTAIRNLVEPENLWGLDGRQDEFAALFYELKEAVRGGKTGDDLADRIRQSPLVPLVQTSLDEQQHRISRDERDKWKETGESAAKGFDIVVQVAEVQRQVSI